MNRGEVWQVDFEPTRGAEIRKPRPAVIVSRDAVGLLPLRSVVPFTDWQPKFGDYPWMVRIAPASGNGLMKVSGADGFQVKSVSTERILVKLGALSAQELLAVIEAIGIVIGHP
jgi:mRNA interferase MazF